MEFQISVLRPQRYVFGVCVCFNPRIFQCFGFDGVCFVFLLFFLFVSNMVSHCLCFFVFWFAFLGLLLGSLNVSILFAVMILLYIVSKDMVLLGKYVGKCGYLSSVGGSDCQASLDAGRSEALRWVLSASPTWHCAPKSVIPNEHGTTPN